MVKCFRTSQGSSMAEQALHTRKDVGSTPGPATRSTRYARSVQANSVRVAQW